MPEIKPLNWIPTQGIGYTVVRRADGGMHFTFLDASPATLDHWRTFSLAHLYDSDRLTTNLYDLRALSNLPEKALQYAAEVNADPAVRNIRLAVVAVAPAVVCALQKLADQAPGGLDLGLFATLDEAEAWLSRPLTLRM